MGGSKQVSLPYRINIPYSNKYTYRDHGMVDGDADDTSHSGKCNRSGIVQPWVFGSVAQPRDARAPHVPFIENMRYLFQSMKNYYG